MGKDPETIRRWIRSGKLRAQKIGLKHMIDEADLPIQDEDAEYAEYAEFLAGLPESMRTMADGRPMPNVLAWVRASRAGH